MKKLLGLLVLIGAIVSVAAFRIGGNTPAHTYDWPTELLEFGSITEAVSANGNIQPRNLVVIGSDKPGRLARVFVEAGQPVKAGEALAQLDDYSAQLQVQRAKLAVELAQADVQRAEITRDAASVALQKARDTSGQLNPQSRDTDALDSQKRLAEVALKAAQLKVHETHVAQQLAEQALEMTIVRSPIAGIVLEKRAVAGQQIGPPISAQLFSVAPELEHMQVTAGAAEAEVGKLRGGQIARFNVNAYAERTFEGKVTRIATTAADVQGAVQFPVTVEVVNIRDAATREWMLRPGMTASVDIIARKHDAVWKMPAAAPSVQIDETQLPGDAKKKLSRWKTRGDRGDWIRIWALGDDHSPRPLFVRVGGHGVHNETGITDGSHVEILAWDPEEPLPPAGAVIRIITAVPDEAKPKAGLKLF